MIKRKATRMANDTGKVSFTEKDVSDAKMVKRSYPEAVFVTRGAQNHLILGDEDRVTVAVLPPSANIFPSIKANNGDFALEQIISSEQKVRSCVRGCQRTRKVNVVTVRWFDSYLEEFEATEVRFGSDILFLRLVDGKNRHIPLRNVRWFGMTKESHQRY